MALSFVSLPSLGLSLGSALSGIERTAFSAVREQEGLLRRFRQQVNGGDALSLLKKEDYVLAPGSAVAVTGASDGIGKEAAIFLAQAGYVPIVCARSEEKTAAAVAAVQQKAGLGARVAGVSFDLADASSVERGIAEIASTAETLEAPLRGLLLNAGVWPMERRVTADGLEEGFQVCHVAHWQLAEGLVPLMLETSAEDEVRVVTVASSAHSLTDSIDLTDAAWADRSWDASTAYGESKLANVLFAQELARRHAPQRLTSLALHPGVVATSLFREFGLSSASTGGGAAQLPLPPSAQLDAAIASAADALLEAPPVKLLLKTPASGCRTSLYSLLAPGLPTGAYLSDCELTDVSPAAKDPAARAALWRWTAEWVAAKRSGFAATAPEPPPAEEVPPVAAEAAATATVEEEAGEEATTTEVEAEAEKEAEAVEEEAVAEEEAEVGDQLGSTVDKLDL